MDIFDAVSILGESYINIKNNMKNDDDPIEFVIKDFARTKASVDKLYNDEIESFNKERLAKWRLLD